MNTQEKLEKLKEFKNEKEFREFLIDLLKKMGFTDVFHTHRYGDPEKGKDIVAKYHHPLEGNEWYSFVVKHGRISGGTAEIETVKGQIKQSFEYPYDDLSGKEIKINKVKVVTNENITGGAQSQIATSTELRTFNNFEFWWNEKLLQYIDNHYPDFWLPGDAFTKEYSKEFIKKIETEFELKELTLTKIDDRRLQRLLNIFIEPKISHSVIIEDKVTKEKSIKNKWYNIKTVSEIEEHMYISGDQGAGKTKVLNTLACQVASIENITKYKTIPIKLKAPYIKEKNYDFQTILIGELKNLSGIFYSYDIIKEYGYKFYLFIDDLDVLNKNDKAEFLERIEEFCNLSKSKFIIATRKDEMEFETGVKTLKIHNFNAKQVEAFITKFFEGSERGKHFIAVLKESDILSKLPTTPLTITLLSLLYDENNYEIPATLTDIYSDFTSVLLGKLNVRNKTELLVLNIKRRIFTTLSLLLLKTNKLEIPFVDFSTYINSFLTDRGYTSQSDEELEDIIERSGILYIDDNRFVGFKQQAFIEFFASYEIYHHERETCYTLLIQNFNDVTWQNTAIFYAGHSKELHGMIDDVIEKAPNNDLKDWFVNTGGMGYLAQALYQTKPSERKKLVMKSEDNLLKAFHDLRKQTEDKESFFYRVPLPLISSIINYWFTENYKSITLKQTLIESFLEIEASSPDSEKPEFENNFKMLMIASSLVIPYIGEEQYFDKLLARKSFLNHPVLPLIADFALEIGFIHHKSTDDEKRKLLRKQIEKKREFVAKLIKEPAFRFNDNLLLDE